MAIIFCVLFLLLSSSTACNQCVNQSKVSYFSKTSALSSGACRYGSLALGLGGGHTAAAVPSLYKDGAACGGICFQVRCRNKALCSSRGTTMVMTDLNHNNKADLVLSSRAFRALANKGMDKEILKQKVVDVEYKRLYLIMEQRRFALFRIGPIGCALGPVAMYGTSGSICVDYINKAVQIFNTKLKTLVDDLNNYFQDAKYSYINAYDLLSVTSVEIKDIISTIINPCCPVANLPTNNGILTCIPLSSACPIRTAKLFWDGIHPSEAANLITGGRAYIALYPTDTYPIDIRGLIQLP